MIMFHVNSNGLNPSDPLSRAIRVCAWVLIGMAFFLVAVSILGFVVLCSLPFVL